MYISIWPNVHVYMYTKGIILNILGNCLFISTEAKYILPGDPAILLLGTYVYSKTKYKTSWWHYA